MTVTRDAEWVNREYGAEKWPNIERLISALGSTDRVHDLARAVAQVSRSEVYSNAESTVRMRAVMAGVTLEVARSIAFGAYQQFVVDSVVDACTEATDTVIELGSGWGRNLFRVWLGGGPSAATYIGAELTDSGRRAASRLADLEPRLSYVSHPFDYHSPRLPNAKDARHAVVFTAHSVEQIPQISPVLLESIMASGQSVTCLHFEPVGWQLGIPADGRDGSSEQYAQAHDYNRNLVAELRAAESASKLRIDHIDHDAVGFNPHNATTMIRWHSEPPAA